MSGGEIVTDGRQSRHPQWAPLTSPSVGATHITLHGCQSRHPCLGPSVSMDCAEVSKVGQCQGQDGHRVLLFMDV